MKKIPTLFERDWNGDRSRVLDQVHVGCEWVLASEGMATRKLDGTSCMVRGNTLYKRREFRFAYDAPANFEEVDYDKETEKTIGWIPVGEGPEDQWHREAFENLKSAHLAWISKIDPSSAVPDGTYELIGPKIQGNPEHWPHHALIHHNGTHQYPEAPRTFQGLRDWFMGTDIEGLVWHHPDGRMAKLKLRDFGIKRRPPA